MYVYYSPPFADKRPYDVRIHTASVRKVIAWLDSGLWHYNQGVVIEGCITACYCNIQEWCNESITSKKRCKCNHFKYLVSTINSITDEWIYTRRFGFMRALGVVNIWRWEDNSEIVPGGLRMYLWEPKSSGFEAMNMLGSPSRPLNLTELDTWYTIQFSVHVNLAKCLSGISTCQQKILIVQIFILSLQKYNNACLLESFAPPNHTIYKVLHTLNDCNLLLHDQVVQTWSHLYTTTNTTRSNHKWFAN